MCGATSPICRAPASSDPRWIARARTVRARAIWVLLFCLQILASGCNISSPKNLGDSRLHDEKDYSANAEQMRLRMRALVQPFSGAIAASADQILASTTDPAVRREALLWKIEAVPAIREALFQPNPKTAMLDTWVMTFQMTDYFETGPGAKGLGDARGIAVTTSQQLEAEMAQIATSMTFSGDMTKVRDFARKWAAEHPMRYSIASRESTLNLATQKAIAAEFSTQEAVGSVVVSVDDLNRRLEIYSAQLPEQSRWQAELFAMDLTGQYELEKTMPLAESAVKSAGRAVDALDRAIPAAERSLAVLEKAPEMLTAEREATVKAVTAEMARTTTFVHEEREAVIKQISAERMATVHDLREALDQQRQALTQDGERVALAAVDHTFLRAAQLCAAALVAVFLGAALLMLLARWMFAGPRRAAASQQPSEPTSPRHPRPIPPQGPRLGGEGAHAAT